MINLVSSTPANNSDGHYLDDNIYLQFDQEIESSYLTSTYFGIWRTNNRMTEFYEKIAATVEKSSRDPKVVVLNPVLNLNPDTYYVVVVVGGSQGVRSISGDTFPSNVVVKFETGKTVRPSERVSAAIEGVDLYIDGGGNYGYPSSPSTDLFSSEGVGAAISLVRTIPENLSVGVTSLANISFIYNDAVDDSVAPDILVGRYVMLPYDPNPFEVRTIQSSGVVVAGNSVTFDIPDLEDTTNREYIFKLPAMKISGANRQALDPEEHVVRFMGVLTPLYATPDQIVMRLAGYNPDVQINMPTYDLYKLIHEISMWVRDEMGFTPETVSLHRLNRLVICYVLRELFEMGLVIAGGRVRSRELILTKVSYQNIDFEDIKTAIDECIREALPEGTFPVYTGIKSGAYLDRGSRGKNYGVYR